MKHLVILLLLGFSFSSRSQDLILKKDSSRIFCKIIGVDSSTIYFEDHKDRSAGKRISRTEVLQYYRANAGSPNEQHPALENTEKKIRFQFGFYGGSAIPYKDFKNNDPNNDSAGFAKKGMNLTLTGVVKLRPWIGIQVNYLYQKHNFDDQAIVSNLLANNYGDNFSGSSTPWKINGVMGGIYLSFQSRSAPRFFVEMGGLAGELNFVSPKVSITHYQYSNTETITQMSARSRAVAYSAYLGFRYRLAAKICLATAVDVLASRPRFSDVRVTDSGTFTNASGVTSFSQQVRTFNVRLGSLLQFQDLSCPKIFDKS